MIQNLNLDPISDLSIHYSSIRHMIGMEPQPDTLSILTRAKAGSCLNSNWIRRSLRPALFESFSSVFDITLVLLHEMIE